MMQSRQESGHDAFEVHRPQTSFAPPKPGVDPSWPKAEWPAALTRKLDRHTQGADERCMPSLAGLAAVVTVLLCVVAAAPAQAATVSLTEASERPAEAGNILIYRAAPGELNLVRLVLSGESGGDRIRLLVSDATAPLTAGPGCTSLDAYTADCRPTAPPRDAYSSVVSANVRLGDGDDRAEAVVGGAAADGRFDFWGEEGNDRLLIPSYRYFRGDLRGGPGNDVLHGFGSAHVLDGGPGADKIVGGRGFDRLRDGDPDGAPAADTIDGGGGRGRDTLDYTGRTRPFRVDLAAGRGGAAGEGDRIAGVEEVLGGRGDDVLLGGRRGDALDGRGGTDFVGGRGGGDRLTVGNGDRASGGSGNDQLSVGGNADVSCGAGRDDEVAEVSRPTVGPTLLRDCELLFHNPNVTDTPTGLYVDPRARLIGRVVRLRVRCGDCARGRIRVTSAGRPFRVLARGEFRLRPVPHAFGHESMGSAAVSVPPDVARSVRSKRLRFVLEAPGYRVVWKTRVAADGSRVG